MVTTVTVASEEQGSRVGDDRKNKKFSAEEAKNEGSTIMVLA